MEGKEVFSRIKRSKNTGVYVRSIAYLNPELLHKQYFEGGYYLKKVEAE